MASAFHLYKLAKVTMRQFKFLSSMTEAYGYSRDQTPGITDMGTEVSEVLLNGQNRRTRNKTLNPKAQSLSPERHE